MPGKQTVCRHRLLILARSVQHDVNNALDVAVDRRQRPDVDTKTTRDRRSNLLSIQVFTFDFARLDNILGESLEHRLFS